MTSALRPVARASAPTTAARLHCQTPVRNGTATHAIAEAERILGRLRTVLKDRIAQLPQRQRLAQLDADGKALRNWFSDESRVPSFASITRALVKLHDSECWRLAATVLAAQAARIEGGIGLGEAQDAEDLAEAHADAAVRRAGVEPTPENLDRARAATLRQITHGFAVLQALEQVRPLGLSHYGRA